MKVLFFILLPIAFLLYSCVVSSPAQPQECVDFYGTATYELFSDSLSADLEIDFVGHLDAKFGAMTDSGRIVTAKLTGIFTAPLGERSFTKTGSLILGGIFNQTSKENELSLLVTSGTEEFIGTNGHLYWSWEPGAEMIYHDGTLCF